MARVILRHRLLEVAVKPLGLLAACGHQRTSQHYQTSASHEPKSNLHGLHAITCRAAGDSMQTVKIRLRLMGCTGLVVLACALVAAGSEQAERLNRDFQKAVAQYDAGHFPEAAAQLENLLRDAPESFEVHELLGLVYAGESQDALANQHLEKAVRLKPDSAAARTNLATSFVRLGKLEGAQEQLKKAVVLEPRNFDANHNLGELYVRMGKLPDAVPFLKDAQRINPSSYDNGYDLALAYLYTGRPAQARQLVEGI